MLRRLGSCLALRRSALQLIRGFFGLLRAQGAEAQASARDNLLSALGEISAAYSRVPGPFFAGELFSLADVFTWPFIARLSVLKELRGFTIPDEPQYAALRAYISAMRSRKSVQETLFEDAWLAGMRPLSEPPKPEA
jgi:glutathione S-transferase